MILDKSNHFLIIFLVTLSLFQASEPINVKLLKGSNDILQGDDVYYAPFWGLIFTDEGVAQNIYNLSLANIRKSLVADVPLGKKEEMQASASAFLAKEPVTETERLASILYHKAAGVFGVATAHGNPTTKFTPKIIGTILRKVKAYLLLKNLLRNFDGSKYSSQKAINEALQDYIVDYAKRLEHPSLYDIAAVKNSFAKFQKNKEKFIKEDLFLRSLQAYLNNLGFESREYSVFINSLAGALDECDIHNAHAMYPANTAQGLLLGVLVRKTETKQDIKDYFESFDPTIDVPNSFMTLQYSDEEIQQVLSQGLRLSKERQIAAFGDFVCCYVYQKHYSASIPMFAFASNQVVYDGKMFEDADCVETIVRGFANLVTFDSKTKTLGHDHAGARMSSVLRDYYQQDSQHRVVDSIAHVKSHQDWVPLVENIPGVSYNVVKVKGQLHQVKNGFYIPSAKTAKELAEQDGYTEELLLIGGVNYSVYVKKYNGKSYTFIPSDSGLVCYEVKATVANLIILMQHLFELSLNYSIDDIFNVEKTVHVFVEMLQEFGLYIDEENIQKLKLFVAEFSKQSIKICKGTTCFALNFIGGAGHADLQLLDKGEVPFVGFTENDRVLYQTYPAEVAARYAMASSYSSSSNSVQLLNLEVAPELLSFLNTRTLLKYRGFVEKDLFADLKSKFLKLFSNKKVVLFYAKNILIKREFSYDLLKVFIDYSKQYQSILEAVKVLAKYDFLIGPTVSFAETLQHYIQDMDNEKILLLLKLQIQLFYMSTYKNMVLSVHNVFTRDLLVFLKNNASSIEQQPVWYQRQVLHLIEGSFTTKEFNLWVIKDLLYKENLIGLLYEFLKILHVLQVKESLLEFTQSILSHIIHTLFSLHEYHFFSDHKDLLLSIKGFKKTLYKKYKKEYASFVLEDEYLLQENARCLRHVVGIFSDNQVNKLLLLYLETLLLFSQNNIIPSDIVETLLSLPTFKTLEERDLKGVFLEKLKDENYEDDLKRKINEHLFDVKNQDSLSVDVVQ